jgi:hypothetical protein
MAKRGSVEAFKEAEARRQERIKSPKASNMSDARKQKRDAFNAKVKSINESTVNKSSLDRFKKAEADRKARVVSVNKMNPNSPKAKRLLKEQADAKKDLPKSAAPGPMAKDRVASAATIGATSTAEAAPIASPKKESTATPKKSVDLSGFGEAFKKARAEGVGTKFAYDDKMYSAVTKDDISRSGKSSLQDFLNSTKRTETTIAKAPGQIVQKKSGGMADPEKKDKIKKMIASAKGAAESFRTPGMRQQRLRDRYDSMTKNMSGAAITESEDFKQILLKVKCEITYGTNAINQDAMDRFKSGGSVMARGCKLGRKKPTKLY